MGSMGEAKLLFQSLTLDIVVVSVLAFTYYSRTPSTILIQSQCRL